MSGVGVTVDDHRENRIWRTTGRVLLALVLVLGAVAGIRVSTLWLDSRGTPAGWARSTGDDAMWLGHAWVDGRRSAADVRRLAARLRGTGIRDLFVHVGPLKRDGALPASRHPAARAFLDAAHRYLRGVRVSAWLGQRVDDGYDLAAAATRHATAAAAGRLVHDGFDGIHYDFEPVSSGDPGLPALLRETRPVLRGRPLSVSVPQLEPVPGVRLPLHLVAGHDRYWTAGYLTEVARACDQVALMVYDSAMPTSSLFAGYVADQTRRVASAVPARTALLVGVPAYHDTTVTHRPGAETVAAGARGVRLGLAAYGHPRPHTGVALYVDFAATERDWRQYRGGWVRPR